MVYLVANYLNFTIAWSIIDFLNNGKALFNEIAGIVITIIGAILILFGAWQLFKAITAQQGSGGHYVKAALAVFIGGALVFGGWTTMSNIAKGGKTTIEDLGKGAKASTIILMNIADVNSTNLLKPYDMDLTKVDVKE